MKARVLLFLMLVLGGLFVVPVVNGLAQWTRGSWDGAALYNMDLPAGWLNRALYAAGISGAPSDVVIGREGWLYLGDNYERTRTVTRTPQNADDRARAGQVVLGGRAWQEWLQQRGVRVYRVMIAPNKESVYPEFLPHWARPADAGLADAVMAAGGGNHVDLRPAMRAARKAYLQPLYYRTDTHWNAAGAAVGFQAFAAHVHPDAAGLLWPSADAAEVLRVRSRAGGDLANFLRLSEVLTDFEPLTRTKLQANSPAVYDLASGAALPAGAEATEYLRKPVLVVSGEALNQARVLWLRDSFGDALLPSMAATFSHTVHYPWARALGSPRYLAALVERWRPEYVFVTVAERHLQAQAFTNLPPDAVER